MMSEDILARVRKIRALIVDIDGVMTDGRIVYSIYGDELKFFDVQDGLGLALLNRAGIKTFIITAKKSRIVKLRAKDMNVTRAYHGYHDKLIPFNDILGRFRLAAEEMCFIGDDIIDIPVLKRVGFSVAVPNAVDEVKQTTHYMTQKSGGRGAVREICDLILKSQDKWDLVTGCYFR